MTDVSLFHALLINELLLLLFDLNKLVLDLCCFFHDSCVFSKKFICNRYFFVVRRKQPWKQIAKKWKRCCCIVYARIYQSVEDFQIFIEAVELQRLKQRPPICNSKTSAVESWVFTVCSSHTGKHYPKPFNHVRRPNDDPFVCRSFPFPVSQPQFAELMTANDIAGLLLSRMASAGKFKI